MNRLSVTRLSVGPLSANCYLVVNNQTNECIIIDPGGEAERIQTCCIACHPVAVLLTHGHFDHCSAVDAICAKYGIPLYVHKADLPILTDSERNVSSLFGQPLNITTPAIPVTDGQVLTLAGLNITVLHTPGHTEGSVCYLLPDHLGLLSGDTLMAHGYGRTDFPGGDFRKIRDSLHKLFHLTPKIKLYPGHDEESFVGRDSEEA